jgi:hypothetical protein
MKNTPTETTITTITTETTTTESTWALIAIENAWPDPVLLKNTDPGRLPGFPYSRGGFRNRCTGKDADPALTANLFTIGKFPAIRRADLICWLDAKTTSKRTA